MSVATDRLKREQQERLAQEQEAADFQWLMGHAQGRRLLHSWLQKTGVYAQSYTGDEGTYYREGRRSVGLDLLADVNRLCPAKFITMLEEQQNARTSD